MLSPSTLLPGELLLSSFCTYSYIRSHPLLTLIFLFLSSVASLRKSVALSVLFFCLTLTFVLLAICKHIYFCCVCSINANIHVLYV